MSETSQSYQCGICGAVRQVYYETDLDPEIVKHWLNKTRLLCEPCAEFERRRAALRDHICRAAYILLRFQKNQTEQPAVEALLGKLEYRLRELRQHVAGHHDREPVHEESWREAIVKCPQNVRDILDRMERSIREQPTEPETTERRT